MATTKFTPATDAQINFLKSLADRRDITALPMGEREVVERVLSNPLACSKALASDAITFAKAAPFPEREPLTASTLPKSTYAERRAASDAAKQEVESLKALLKNPDTAVLGRTAQVEQDLYEATDRYHVALNRTHAFVLGDEVEIVRGRKYPKGLHGVVLWSGEGHYGPQVLIWLTDARPGLYQNKKGEPKIYINPDNLAHIG
jgi:hypothetical protein